MSADVGQDRIARHQGVAAADLPVEGMMPSFEGANEWLNSQPLTPGGLRGKVVVVQFWTYTCVNWLRTQAYFRAWRQRYRDHGLVTIGVHTPEFKFEHDVDNVRWAVQARKIDYPVAIDNDLVWQALQLLLGLPSTSLMRRVGSGITVSARAITNVRDGHPALSPMPASKTYSPGWFWSSRTAMRSKPIGRTSGRLTHPL